jgi:hypothetical protein
MTKALKVFLIGLVCFVYSGVYANTTFQNYWGSVNAKDFGAVGNGSTDDTAAIQATIDAAYAAGIQRVYLPPTGNCYKTTSSLFLDAPGNLRSSLSNPTIFAFSMTLAGEPSGGANHEGWGTRICPNFNNGVALWVGTGQGMGVTDVLIQGPNNGYRGQLNANGVGIGVAGGSGGTSRTLIENVWVENFYSCFETGANGNSNLADSNTIRKSVFTNCYNGLYFSQAQNDINDAVEDSIGATIAYNSSMGRAVTVLGGNPSAVSGKSNSFSISSVSSVTATPVGNTFTLTFTAVVASPDSTITGCPTIGSNLVSACVYNSWMFNTAHFGVVPATMTQFNTSTGVGTFQVLQNWIVGNYNNANVATATDFQNEIQAVTTVYGAERVTVFYGTAFNTLGVHIENPGGCTTFVDSFSGFTGDAKSLIQRSYFNYDPGMTTYKPSNSPTGPNLALFYCAQSFPFIVQEASAGDITFDANTFGQNYQSEPIIIDIQPNTTARLIFRDNGNTIYAPNVRNGRSIQGFTVITCSNGAAPQFNDCLATGGGEWDRTPFLAHTSTPFNKPWSNDNTEFWGSQPAFDKAPRLTPTEVTALGSLGALGSYNTVFGNVDYQVTDWNTGAPATHFARWAHTFASYGTNLTTSNVSGLTVSYKGQTDVVYLDVLSITYMFAGLSINLNNGGGSVPYVVTGVYPALGYITVCETTSDTSFSLLAGTKTTVYTPNSILQASYSVTQF